jgi:hypothetical protein
MRLAGKKPAFEHLNFGLLSFHSSGLAFAALVNVS